MGQSQRDEGCLNSEPKKTSDFSGSNRSYSCSPEGTVGQVEEGTQELTVYI